MPFFSKSLFAVAIAALLPVPVIANWRTDFPSVTRESFIEALTLDPQLNPIAIGRLDGRTTVVKLSRATGQVIWSRTLASFSQPDLPPFPGTVSPQPLLVASDIDTDASGNVFVTGWVQYPVSTRCVVAALDGSNGNFLWRRNLGRGYGAGLVHDGAGGVIVSQKCSGNCSSRVVKLAATSGAMVWQWETSEKTSERMIRPPAIDAAGNVFVASGTYAAAVSKIDGLSGVELWSQTCSPYPRKIVVDSAGDIFVGCYYSASAPGDRVEKRDGSTGALVWAYHTPISVRDLAVTSNDDVIAVGKWGIPNGDTWGGAVRLDGATNAEIWTTYSFGPPAGAGFGPMGYGILAVALDANDDVYAAGAAGNFALVRKLDGAAGSVLWEHEIHGGSTSTDSGTDGSEWASTLVLDGAGFLFVGGLVVNVAANEDSVEGFVQRLVAGSNGGFYTGELNPLWENWFLWVYTYSDVDRLVAVIEEALVNPPDLERAIWTSDVHMLLKAPDRFVILTPRSEKEALVWIAENQRELASRTAPLHVFLEEGGAGAALLDELLTAGILE